MERLKSIKEMLMCCVEGQMSHLDTVDTKELGEAIDMIKDLEEAMYYCTITKAMTEKDDYDERKYMMPYYNEDRKYMNDNNNTSNRRNHSENDMMYRRYMNSNNRGLTFEEWAKQEEMEMSHNPEAHDMKEGRSHKSRKMYMESKEKHQDKASQMRELERYMQELTQDVVEMVEDASVEEKQYLSKRVAALANKLSQLND